jgi:uncharacterized protein (UPF0335 family)
MSVMSWVESNLLQNESRQLARLQAELRRQIAAKEHYLAELATEIERQQDSLAQLNRTRFSLAGELASLEQQQGSYRASAEAAAAATATAQAELREFIAEQERASAELATIANQHHQLSAELASLEAAKATERKAIEQLQQQQQRLQQQIARLEAELTATAATVATERERATTAIAAAAAAARDEAEAEMAEIAATVAGARASAEAELAGARAEIEAARAHAGQIRDEAIAAAEAEIDLARRRFEVETAAVLNTIEKDKIDATKEINSDQRALLERWGPILTAPLEAEIAELEAENGRLAKLLSAKAGKPLEWQPEQIKQLLVRALDDGNLRPNHLRIAGESESGKSHLVNQLLTSGIAAMGLSCDIELYDPYPSDTHWAISPTIADDPEAVVARLAELRELCESASPAKRQRPLLIVLDEGDELIRQFKTAVTDSLKAILKRGRHVNLILWVMGQNGNVKGLSPMDWSDLKNAGAIYLNQVGYDYIKNGLSGRASNTLQGELDAIAAKHTYYALIHPKGAPRPYAVAVPKRLFPDSPTGVEETPAQAPAQPAPPPGALVCPKCESSRVKRNGGGRIYCHDCGKNSTVGK